MTPTRSMRMIAAIVLGTLSCHDISSPNPSAIIVTASLSSSTASLSTGPALVDLLIVARNPLSVPVTANLGGLWAPSPNDFGWWSADVVPLSNPLAAMITGQNPFGQLVIAPFSEISTKVVFLLTDPPFQLGPGEYRITGGIGQKYATPLTLTVTP